jgi:hypothetical protein
LKIHSESEDVSMDKVVHLFESFKTKFYFKIFRLGKVVFALVKIWKVLKSFEFEIYSNRTTRHCAGWARMSVPHRCAASLTPLPPAPHH